MRNAELLSSVPFQGQSAQDESRLAAFACCRPYFCSQVNSPSLQVLGGFLLTCREGTITGVETPRMQALLSYLALHQGVPQSRTKLAALFWPDSTETQAHTNLRNLLYKLRSALPSSDQWLMSDRHFLLWRDCTYWRLDVLEFERAIARAKQAELESDDTALRVALERAVALYCGELLPGCYDEWVLLERERLNQVFLSVLEHLLCLRGRDGDYPGALALAHRIVREDPFHEAGYRHMMRLYAASGNRAAALRTYHACVRLMNNEFGVGPSVITRQVYEQLFEAEQFSASPR